MTSKKRSLISFDWAIKRLLRSKANFEVLEGFLSELLHRKITIKNISESESNKDDETDKYNRVDILVEDDRGEVFIIELQYDSERDYFHRMLFGTSRAVTEYISEGNPYSNIRKIYSINIVYFDLGGGSDYIYHGKTRFIGVHNADELQLNSKQKELYGKEYPADLCPEYYIIKVNKFNNVAKNTLDEWIYYLKNNEIKDEFTAQGLKRARRILAFDKLSEEEKRTYLRHVDNKRVKENEIETAHDEGWDKGRAEGRAEGLAEGEARGLAQGRAEGEAKGLAEGEAKGRAETIEKIVLDANRTGLSIQQIKTFTKLTKEQVTEILKKHNP
jgi:predicted transposase/invertase (TIGR01784 family)